MAVFDKIQNIMDKTIAPVASKVADSKMLDALMGGMMCTLPMTLGVSVIAILINFPIPGFSDWVVSSGLMATGNSILTVTMNMMGIYISFFIGLRWGKVCGLSGYTGGIVSGAVFLAFMPQQSFEDIPMASFINTSYMGSNGIFVAILLGLIVPKVTAILMSKLEIKLPDMVPPMVADSLSPMFAAIVLFTAVWFAKWGLSFTPWGNLFDMINTLIGTPVTMVGASPLAYIIVCSLQSIFWFFGVHPNVMLNFYAPVIMACSAANTEAIIAGEALPYGAWAVVALGTAIGGQANALGISISLLFTKSERFKASSRHRACSVAFQYLRAAHVRSAGRAESHVLHPVRAEHPGLRHRGPGALRPRSWGCVQSHDSASLGASPAGHRIHAGRHRVPGDLGCGFGGVGAHVYPLHPYG